MMRKKICCDCLGHTFLQISFSDSEMPSPNLEQFSELSYSELLDFLLPCEPLHFCSNCYLIKCLLEAVKFESFDFATYCSTRIDSVLVRDS
jgi:hypothetical protein